jgi:hypothetical protein
MLSITISTPLPAVIRRTPSASEFRKAGCHYRQEAAIITCDLRLNTPRFATLPSTMRSPRSSVFILENSLKAKKKPIAQKSADSNGVDLKPRLQVLKPGEPPHRKAGIRVKSVTELLDKLHDEASRRRRRKISFGSPKQSVRCYAIAMVG